MYYATITISIFGIRLYSYWTELAGVWIMNSWAVVDVGGIGGYNPPCNLKEYKILNVIM